MIDYNKYAIKVNANYFRCNYEFKDNILDFLNIRNRSLLIPFYLFEKDGYYYELFTNLRFKLINNILYSEDLDIYAIVTSDMYLNFYEYRNELIDKKEKIINFINKIKVIKEKDDKEIGNLNLLLLNK